MGNLSSHYPISSFRRYMIFAVCLLLVGALLLLFGCSFWKQNVKPAGPCVGPVSFVNRAGDLTTIEDPMETSALCQLLRDPQYVKMGLFVANTAALRKGLYSTAQALDFIEDVRSHINQPGATVKSIVLATLSELEEIKEYAPEIFIASSWLEDPRYQVDVPLDDYSWYRLNKFLNEQRTLVLLHQTREE